MGRPHANWLPCLLCNFDATNHAASALPMACLMREARLTLRRKFDAVIVVSGFGGFDSHGSFQDGMAIH